MSGPVMGSGSQHTEGGRRPGRRPLLPGAEGGGVRQRAGLRLPGRGRRVGDRDRRTRRRGEPIFARDRRLGHRVAGGTADCRRARGHRHAPQAGRRLERPGAGTGAARPRDRRPCLLRRGVVGHRARARDRARSPRGAEDAGVDSARPARVPARRRSGRSDQQAGARRCVDLRVPGGRLHRAGPLRRGRKGRAVDARHQAGQRAGVDPGRAPARAVRRSRGRRGADGHLVSSDRRCRGGGPRVDPDADRAPLAAHVPDRRGGAAPDRSARRSSPTITTRSRRWPRSARSRAGSPRP